VSENSATEAQKNAKVAESPRVRLRDRISVILRLDSGYCYRHRNYSLQAIVMVIVTIAKRL